MPRGKNLNLASYYSLKLALCWWLMHQFKVQQILSSKRYIIWITTFNDHYLYYNIRILTYHVNVFVYMHALWQHASNWSLSQYILFYFILFFFLNKRSTFRITLISNLILLKKSKTIQVHTGEIDWLTDSCLFNISYIAYFLILILMHYCHFCCTYILPT